MVQLAAIIASHAKEILYQAVPYVGMAKVFDFLQATNEVLQSRGIRLPLEGQSTTSSDTRRYKGLEVQRRLLGEKVDQLYAQSPKDQPEAVAYFREHLAHPCAECIDFLARTPGPGLLDGQMDALLLHLAPAPHEEPRLDEVGCARVRRGLRGPGQPWRKVAATVVLAAGLAGLIVLTHAQVRPPEQEKGAWDGVKGVGRLALEASVVAREPGGNLRRMDPGAIASRTGLEQPGLLVPRLRVLRLQLRHGSALSHEAARPAVTPDRGWGARAGLH